MERGAWRAKVHRVTEMDMTEAIQHMQSLYHLYKNKCEPSRVAKNQRIPRNCVANCFKRKKGSCREKVRDQKFIQVRPELASLTKKPKMFWKGSKW